MVGRYGRQRKAAGVTILTVLGFVVVVLSVCAWSEHAHDDAARLGARTSVIGNVLWSVGTNESQAGHRSPLGLLRGW